MPASRVRRQDEDGARVELRRRGCAERDVVPRSHVVAGAAVALIGDTQDREVCGIDQGDRRGHDEQQGKKKPGDAAEPDGHGVTSGWGDESSEGPGSPLASGDGAPEPVESFHQPSLLGRDLGCVIHRSPQ